MPRKDPASRPAKLLSASAVNLGDITTYQAGVAQAAMHRALQKRCDDILKPFGITKMQWLIIGTVLDAGDSGMRLSDMATQLGTTLSYLTNTINLLESRGFVDRRDHESDNRAKMIVIRPEFKDKCADIERTLREGLRKTIYANVNQKDFQTYIKVLYQLKDAA